MISKVEALQRLKKMGVSVADDHSIVTVLLPAEVSFEAGLKDIRQKLTEIGYDSSFCVKQSRDTIVQAGSLGTDLAPESQDRKENSPQEELSSEEIRGYMAVDAGGQFALEDDGQFTLGLDY